MKIKNAAKLFVPSIFLEPFKNVLTEKKTNPPLSLSQDLFDNEPNFLEALIENSSVYGEYGTGVSTQFALNFSKANVYCIDSDTEWLEKAARGFEDSSRLHSRSVDVGKVIAWGIPVGAARIDAYKEYTDWIWSQKEKPDLVLIDGRFRVCCFLSVLRYAEAGTKVIFDDYVHRPQYKFVERFLLPVEILGRQALFVVPDEKQWDEKDLDTCIQAFRCNLN